MASYSGYNLPSKPDRKNVDLPRDSDGNAYLHELCRRDAPLDVIREAVRDLGANVNALNKNNMTPLGVAIGSARPDVVACLLELGAEICFPINKNATFNAVYTAAQAGRGEALKVLLAKGGGAFVNTSGTGSYNYDTTMKPLHIAVKNYHYDMIAPLVAAGAMINEEAGPDKATPLFIAIQNNSAAAVRQVLNAGADLELRQLDTGRTPLIYAAFGRNGAAARALLDLGADPNASDNTGMTALMFAAENSDTNTAQALIEAKADINQARKGNNNETALMTAARKGSSEVCKVLLKAGANPILTDAFNKTALKYAEDYYQHGTRFVLEEAEQKALQNQFETIYRKYRP